MSTSEYPADGIAPLRRGGSWSIGSIRAVPVEAWIVCALVVVAAVIRFLVIDNQSYWSDEALTAYEARLSFGGMLGVVAHVETTPPLYFVLIWAWGHLFGTGEVALRFVSTLAGIAAVPIAYLAGKELASRRAGVLAAALVAVNPFLIWYSQEARAYMLLVALCGLSFLYFARARSDPSVRNVAWWALWSSLALMTHFFAGFLVGPEAVWLLWVARTRAVPHGAAGLGGVAGAGAGGMRGGAVRMAGARLVLVAVGAVAVVQLAMLPFALIDTGHGPGWIAAEPRTDRVSQAISEWGVSILYRRTTIAAGLIAGAVLVLVVVLLAVLGGDRRTRVAVAVAGALAALVWILPLALGIASHSHDYFLSRNVMPAVVPLTVAIGAACAAPRLRLVGGVLALALVVLFAVAAIRVQTRPWLQRPNWRGVAAALGPATVPRAILAANGTTADPLKIYLPGVHWSEPPGRRWLIREVDVVGAIKRLPLLAGRPTDFRGVRRAIPLRDVKLPTGFGAVTGSTALAGVGERPSRLRGVTRRRAGPMGRPVPTIRAPRGMRLIARFRFHNWVLARFALQRPLWVTSRQVAALAPRVFRRVPVALLAFFQPAQR